jgi:hypothetical protein
VTHRQSSTSTRWWRLLLAAIAALVVGVLGAGTASATTLPELGNRVGASTPAGVNIVRPHESIGAGQRWGHAPPDAGIVVATGVAANSVPPRFITTGAGTTIDRLAVSTSISAQRQGRHVLGARQYGGGSYFNSADDAQRVLDDFHSGSAQVLGVKGNDIVVRAPNVTGFNHNPGAGFPDQATNVFFIKGSSSPSVVPYNPGWSP